MDAYEATRIVLSRIQSLDPENASKIMGLLLIQDHGEKEMIRLAFGPEGLLHSVVLKARKDLGLLPPSTPSTPSSPSPSPFLLARQNSASRILGGGGGGSGLPSPSSWAPPPVFSRSSSANGNGGSGINGVVDDLQGGDELISSSNSSYGVSMPPPSSSCSSPSPFFGGDLIEDFQLHDQLSFLNDPAAAAAAAASSPNSIHALQIGPKGNGDMFYPDMAGDCRSPSSNGEGMHFPYAGMSWGMSHHRRSYSAADRCLSSEVGSDFGWRPCLYFARGYCKNGSSCRFLHGLPDDAAAAIAGSKMDAVMEQQFHELLLRSKSQRLGSASQLMATAASFPYSHTAASPASGKCMNFLLQPQQQQQQQNESQRVAAATAAAAAALSLCGDEPHKFGRSRLERNEYAGTVNPGSRQIYLTFPADSTFREEDVANYFSIYGPVQDVRIPYQQKRMFGFVTFVYPETVKLILAKGNPHFVCDARVLVKPYKEKGKVPDKKQQQQQAERGVFSGCSTPTGLDSKDSYDLQLLGASMLYNSSQEVLLRKKLEEQQQAAELQQAIELQRRRFMGLQLLDLKARNLSSPAVPVTASLPSPSPINPYTTAVAGPNAAPSATAEGSAEELPPPEAAATTVVAQAGAAAAATTASAAAAAAAAAAAEKLNTHAFLQQQQQQPVNAAAGADKEDSARDGSPKADGDFQESAEHNLPDSPFASPTKCSFPGVDAFSVVTEAEPSSAVSASPNNNAEGCIGNSNNNNSHLITSSLLPAPSTLDMASFNSCFFPITRFSSGHGAVGM